MAQKIQTSWDLSPLFKSDTDPNIAKNQKGATLHVQKFVKKWQKRTDYMRDPKVLKQALDEYERLFCSYGYSGAVGYYFSLRSSQETDSPKIKAFQNKSIEQYNKNKNDSQFFEINLTKISLSNQKKFLADNNLAPYKHFLEKIFIEAPHWLSDAEEKIMNLKNLPAYTSWTKMTQGFISSEERLVLNESGKKELKNFSEIMGLINHRNKKIRDSAAEGLNDIVGQNAKIATEEMNAIMANKKINDELRKYPRPESARLMSDDVNEKIVDTLVEVVSSRNILANRFYKLKAKLFNVEKLAYHERNLDYGKLEKEYEFSEAVELVSEVLEKLDPKFNQIFSMFLEKGQVDVFPKKGKKSGAFCSYNLPTQPSFVLLNYTKKLNDVMTVAHEFGHAINNELIREKQNSLNFGTPTSTAEVASVFMEDFVLEKILEKADDEERLAIMMMRLNEDISTVFRQIACFRFEQELHQQFREKGFLSPEEIGIIFQKHMSAYMGPGVEQSKGSQNWWVYWNHIRTFFYVYSYAGGALISKSLRAQVRQDPKNIEGVKTFLSTGLSKSPKDIFAELGIDITKRSFWDQGLSEIEETLNETEKLAKKLGKI